MCSAFLCEKQVKAFLNVDAAATQKVCSATLLNKHLTAVKINKHKKAKI